MDAPENPRHAGCELANVRKVSMNANETLSSFTPSTAPARATLTIEASHKATHAVSPYLFGKFCEHLGNNIYQGMEAQILTNPTLARWVFNGGTDRVNGGMHAEYEPARIARLSAESARRLGYPDGQLLVDDYMDGLAYGWFRLGSREEVRVSADAGPHGDRAQRVEVLRVPDGQPRGIAQWTYLPLHRTRGYQYRLVARAAQPTELTLSLNSVHTMNEPVARLATATVTLGPAWQTFEGTLYLPEHARRNPEGLYRLDITTKSPANVVVDRVLLYPDDHIAHFDPDIVRLLKESRLPLLRWPGGNFVSGYRWRLGVGPIDARPTLPNPAWESLEYNLFGTDEFIRYCREVGCEPMICVNAGDGTPEEAAAWVEYCNGSFETPMGRLRAENGHPEPYGVRLWEIGNELDGRHQVSWTTPGGYADRYLCFERAMRAADPDMRILACGSEWRVHSEWNTALIEQAAPELNTITHHVLNGGSVDERTNPTALYHSFMGYAQPLGEKYRQLRAEMAAGGVAEPRIAITELQLFSHFQGPAGIGNDLSPATMPTNQTISEALYVTTILHECIRMGDAVELVTHSATVNHGGGLRKTRERVWANPIHHAHSMLGELRGGIPVAIALESPVYTVTESFDNGVMPPLEDVPAIDALAVLSPDGTRLILSLVHRSAETGPIELSIDTGELELDGQAEVVTLCGQTWWDQNTPDEPERITAGRSTLAIEHQPVMLTLPPYSYTQVILAIRQER